MHTAEPTFSNFVIEYPGEIETEIENILACYQGPRWVWIMIKMEVENLVTHSL